jgi:mRNA interferase MazF
VSFDRFAVVRVPFPFTDRGASKNRPALVLSDSGAFNTPAGHSVMAMITSQGNSPWPLDCPLADLTVAGLPAPSKVRFKLFTLDHRLVRGELGRLASGDAAKVGAALAELLGGKREAAAARQPRQQGSAQDQVGIAEDFDAPLDDFKDPQ